MRSIILKVTTALIVLVATPSQTLAQFVRVDGQQFVLGGEPYYFVGTNFWYGAYLGSTGKVGNRDRLAQELDLLAENGITNLRVLAASESSSLIKSVKPSIQSAPGELDEQLLLGLDYLLVEMAKRDMKAVLYLNNFWQWSGGMTQYLQWAEKRSIPDPDITGDWDAYISESAGFYRSAKAQSLFLDFVEQIVSRVNNISNIKYQDDPTIMAWELANEPRAGINDLPEDAKQPFINWVASTSHYIKRLDRNHLVTTGSEGTAGTSNDSDLFIEAHRTSDIDYLTVHLWPKNWGWLNMHEAEQSYPVAIANAKAYLGDHVKYAKLLNKPIVLEEFGVERDSADYSLNSTRKYRDRFFKEVFEFIEASAAVGGPLVGSNFWGWGGLGRAHHGDFIWRAGDSFTGDPPQEHQGLNSVFDSDQSTLKIIQQHGFGLNTISKSKQQLHSKPQH
jgi:mannan endo-1,4-beta-mannosidase